MNKIAIPAILVATVMVAGMFAFMPVEQASTVHLSGTIITTSSADTTQVLADTTAILVDTDITIPASLLLIDDFIDNEVADILLDTVEIGDFTTTAAAEIGDFSAVQGSASNALAIEAVETQIATLVTTGNAAELAGTGTRSEITPIAATGAAGIAYVTVDVTAADTSANADTIDVELNGVVICSFSAEAVAATTCVGAIGAGQSVTVQEVDAVGDNANAAFSAFAVVISNAADTTP